MCPGTRCAPLSFRALTAPGEPCPSVLGSRTERAGVGQRLWMVPIGVEGIPHTPAGWQHLNGNLTSSTHRFPAEGFRETQGTIGESQWRCMS